MAFLALTGNDTSSLACTSNSSAMSISDHGVTFFAEEPMCGTGEGGNTEPCFISVGKQKDEWLAVHCNFFGH
jgi:hypothetical protein